MADHLFTELSNGSAPIQIPTDTKMVRSVGYSQSGRGAATYVHDATVNSSYVSSNPRTSFLAMDGRGFRLAEQILCPEYFGAVGDGVANDTLAFQALAAAVTDRDGGRIACSIGATYVLGLQTLVNDGTWMFKPASICNISGCSKALIIEGNGATLKFASGMRFGTFNSSGSATTNPLPYHGGQKSGPSLDFEGMLTIVGCTGPVSISTLELDGNAGGFVLGGQYGDTGRQIAGDGILMINNTGGERVSDIHVHDMPRDGCNVLNAAAGEAQARARSIFSNFRSSRNARQGMSFAGGRGYTFIGCSFNDTGRGAFVSAPAAGFDIEAEWGPIRDLHFLDCDFTHNVGAGLLADSGDSADLVFEQCRFTGTTSWAAWAAKPRMTFRDCLFVGSVNAPAYASRAAAPLFQKCRWTDDPNHSPTGTVFSWPAVNNASSDMKAALFDRCHWDVGRTMSAGSLGHATIRDCTISCGLNIAFLGCIWEGTNVVNGADPGFIAYGGGVFRGVLSFNGSIVRTGTAAYDPPLLAPGARATPATLPVNYARVGTDRVEVTFSNALQGVRLWGYVSTPNMVIVHFDNPPGGSSVDLGSGTISVTLADVNA